MGTNVSKAAFRALIVPDHRIEGVWLAQSTHTQASPRAGDPVPQQAGTPLVLEASGDQIGVAAPADSVLEVVTQAPGFPAPDARGATNRWRRSTDGAAEWYGWDSKLHPHWEALHWTDGGAPYVLQWTRNPHVAVTLDDWALVVADTRLRVGGNHQLRVWRRDPAGTAWTDAAVGTATMTSAERYPCLVVLPSGRVLLFSWTQGSTFAEIVLEQRYSDDNGATWVLGQPYCFSAALLAGDAIVRMRAAYGHGQILLLVHTTDTTAGAGDYSDQIDQFASRDEGNTFTKIEQWPGTTTRGAARPDVVFTGGLFYVGYYRISTTNAVHHYRTIGNAYDLISGSTEVDIDGTTSSGSVADAGGPGDWQFTDGDASLVLLDSGQVGFIGRDTINPAGEHPVSLQALALTNSWSDRHYLLPTSQVARMEDDTTHIRNYASAFQRGRVLIVHNWDANPGNEDESLGAIWMGGHSRYTLHRPWLDFSALSQASVDLSYYPFDLPQNLGTPWTRTTAGAVNEALVSPGYLNIAGTGGGGTLWYRQTRTHFANVLSYGMMGQLHVNSWTSGEVVYRLLVDDGANQYEASLRLTDAQLELFDENGASLATVAIDTTVPDLQIMLWVAPATPRASAYYRASSKAEPQDWVAIAENQTLAAAASAGAAVQPQFGIRTSGVCDVDLGPLHYLLNGNSGAGSPPNYWTTLAEGFTNPDDLWGRAYANQPVWAGEGVRLRMADGPAIGAQQHDVSVRYDYPDYNVIPTISPSPQHTWRSVSVAPAASTQVPQQQIAFQLDPNGQAAHLGNGSIGLHLQGLNWRTGQLQGRNGAGVWTNLLTLDTATGWAGLRFARSGNAIEVPAAPAVTGNVYLGIDELVGGTVLLDDLAGSVVRREITGNTEGTWTNGTVTKTPTIFITGGGAGDPTTGSMDVWHTRLTAVVHLLGTTDAYQGYRLRIDSQITVGGYAEVGVCLLGPLVLLEQQYSRGRVIEQEANVELAEAADGVRDARRLGPPRRRVQLAWSDPIDSSQLSATTVSPDYLEGTATGGGDPIGLQHDLPRKMLDLHTRLGGPLVPVVYLPRVERGPSDSAQWMERDRSIYCRLTSPVRLESVQGEEAASEVFRVARITLEEEV